LLFQLWQKIGKTFDGAKITLTFKSTSGATVDRVIGVKKQDTIHVLVPHHAQRIYDDPVDRKYEFTVTHQLLNDWELDGENAEMIVDPKEYVVNKRPSADKIAPATKKTIYTLKLKKEKAGEESSNDNSSEAEYDHTVYKIILYTPSISLTLHAPNTHGSMDKKLKRPTTKEADTVEGFDTGYVGVMLRNEDNDDGKIPDSDKPHPRDNDDKVVGSTDDDLVAVLMELNVPDGMPYELKILTQVNLLFEKSTDKQIRVFDIGKSEVKLDDLSNPKNLTEAGGDKHLGELIDKGKATIYLEGLGSSSDEEENRWGDEVEQVTLCLTPGGEYKEASSHGLLLAMDLDIVHPASGELGENREDGKQKDYPHGGYVSLKREGDDGTGKLIDLAPATLLRVQPMAAYAKVKDARYRLKFNAEGRYIIYSDEARTKEVKSEEHQFRADESEPLHFVIQGEKRSNKVAEEKVILQMKIDDSWYDVDVVSFIVVQSEFKIDVRVFIPYNWVNIPHPFHIFEVAEGDSRGFSDKLIGTYRLAQSAIINPYKDLSSKRLIENWKDVGTSTHYKKEDVFNHKNLALHSLDPDYYGPLTPLPGSYITTGATPSSAGKGNIDRVDSYILNAFTNDTQTGIEFLGAAKEPHIVGASDIDWLFLIAIQIDDPLNPQAVFAGAHDGFPAYEVYINANHPIVPVTELLNWKPPLNVGVLELVNGADTEMKEIKTKIK
jgi:hypothetical protein